MNSRMLEIDKIIAIFFVIFVICLSGFIGSIVFLQFESKKLNNTLNDTLQIQSEYIAKKEKLTNLLTQLDSVSTSYKILNNDKARFIFVDINSDIIIDTIEQKLAKEFKEVEVKIDKIDSEPIKQKIFQLTNSLEEFGNYAIDLQSYQVSITYKSNFENYTYNIIEQIQNELPGYVVLGKLTIRPTANSFSVFDLKFNKLSKSDNISDGRLQNNIILYWYFLSKDK
jgi:hypothetical protein